MLHAMMIQDFRGEFKIGPPSPAHGLAETTRGWPHLSNRAPSVLKALYHRIVPPSIRWPIGRFRRAIIDSATRIRYREPLPPSALLQRVQMSPYVDEYLEIGQKCATTISAHLERLYHDHPITLDILDFGCGLGRTLRFLRAKAEWQLHGCDPDAELIDWSAVAIPEARFYISGSTPPLPYTDLRFDAAYAVSVFTHFPFDQQHIWRSELARVIKPDGFLLLTTMGAHALGNFLNLNTAANRAILDDEGFLYIPGSSTFNSHAAFHTAKGIASIFRENFELVHWKAGGLDGFQDFAILRRLAERPQSD